MSKDTISSKRIKGIPNCPERDGTGFVEYFDLTILPKIKFTESGVLSLNYLSDTYGEKELCQKCFSNGQIVN
jgi:hypothetical protein